MNLGAVDTRRYFLAVWAVLTVLFGLLAPEGTAKGPLLPFAQWGLQTGVPLGLMICVQIILARSSRFDRLGAWTKLTLSGAAGALLSVPAAAAVDVWLAGEPGPASWALADVSRLLLDEAFGLVPPALVTWLSVNAPRVLRLDFSRGQTTSRPEPEPESGLLGLLPKRIGRDIVYLQSELHYVRVVTTTGTALVLYNLRDAVSELAGEGGLQPHRSYWVALRHVRQMLKTANGHRLELTGGALVPVARRRVADVRTAL